MNDPWGRGPAERAAVYLELTRQARILQDAVNGMNVSAMKYLGPGMLVAIGQLNREAKVMSGVDPQRHTNTTGPHL